MSRRILPVLLSLVLLLPTPGGLAAAQGSGPIYIVQSGDTLSGIAQTFGTSVAALVDANGLSDAGAIQPGQELSIPGLPQIGGVLTTVTVGPADNLEAIAWRAGLEPAALIRLNRVLHSQRLYVGQSLIVPEAVEGEGDAGRGQAHLVTSEDPQLIQAIEDGANPWSYALEAEGGPRRWWIPEEIVPVRGGEARYRPLPLGIEEIGLWPAPVRQGETLVLEIESDGSTLVEASFDGSSLAIMDKNEGERVALQGIHAMKEPGLYQLEVAFRGPEDGAQYAFRQPLPIRSGGYPLGPVLHVPEETLNPENTQPEEELIAEVLTPATEEKRWEGPFAYPSNYYTEEFPSHFGVRRNYNNRGYFAYHTGLDFYGGVGVEIVAPAPGVVVYSGDLVVRGQTTVIDHGWGVYTMYMHQSERLVPMGEEVETGEVIGLVGATGRVTGPHLHWEVRVGGIPVQPLDWVETAYPPDL